MSHAPLLIFLCSGSAVAADGDRFAWAPPPVDGPGIVLAVDAADLPSQGLAYAREWISGPNLSTLVYPLWIPGTHAPSGPVQNLGGLTVADDHGHPLNWSRDSFDPWKIHVEAAHDARIRLDLIYIANQPTVNSDGVDVVANGNCATINWNCMLFYPQGADIATIACSPSIRLPGRWDFASALELETHDHEILRFKATMLQEAVDSPLICGIGMQHVQLDGIGNSSMTLHLASDSDVPPRISAATLAELKVLPDEAGALFGGAWFKHYDMLVTLGQSVNGLEHCNSALVGIGASDLENVNDAGSREVISHEFTHSWCGKHRRPIGMLTPTYQETPDQQDLWVYEGLTEFLGRVLAVRCGLLSPEDWRASILYDMQGLQRTTGRSWRSVRDTCKCTYQLRAPSQNHDELRRDQDYYTEGEMFWLVVDRNLRAATKGSISIDDFCQHFLGPRGDRKPGYTESELVAALSVLAPLDWAGLIRTWMDRTGPLDTAAILDHSGWSLHRIQVDKGDECELEDVDILTLEGALGCTVIQATVQALEKDGVAAKAGLLVGDVIDHVDGMDIHANRHCLERAVASATATAPLFLTVKRGGEEKQISLVPKPLEIDALSRDANVPDDFAPLLASRRKPAVQGP